MPFSVRTHQALSHVILKLFLQGLVLLVLALLSGWGALAIYFGFSHSFLLQIILTGGFALASFATLIGIWIKPWRRRFLASYTVLFACVLLWWFNITPSNDRVWQMDIAQLPYATIEGNLVTVHNIRNFTYRSETDYTPAYATRTYDLSKLDSASIGAVIIPRCRPVYMFTTQGSRRCVTVVTLTKKFSLLPAPR